MSVAPSQHAGHFVAPVRMGEALSGPFDGFGTVYTTAETFVHLPPGITIQLYFNGLRQRQGSGLDFTVAESGGVGTGYDTILLASPPHDLGAPHVDNVTADYTVA